MRAAFGEKPSEQLERARQYIVGTLGASELISTRVFYHAHFSSADKAKAALARSQQLQPAGAVCLQRQCGQERHSVEGRVQRAGLDYSSLRRWIIANKRILLTEEVFRDVRKEAGERKEEEAEAARQTAAVEQQVRRRINETQKELGYAALPASERQEPEQAEESAPAASLAAALAAAATPLSTASQPSSLPSGPASSASPAGVPVKRASPLKVYVKSRQGSSWDPAKINQDRPLACVPLRGHAGVHVYGVMDGHGQHGHHVSEFIMSTLPAFLSAEQRLKDDTQAAMRSAVSHVCSELSSAKINLAFSGSTLVFAVHCNDTLYVANIGDSRCVVVQEPDVAGFPPFTLPLTTDHKPDLPAERQRIIAAGGRVCPIPGMESGQSRVWLRDLDEPGLAMSRSIGDEVSASVGVISEPELSVHRLGEKDVCALFASDGIWEFISNEEAVQILWKNRDQPAVAVNQLVAEAVKRWQEVSR